MKTTIFNKNIEYRSFHCGYNLKYSFLSLSHLTTSCSDIIPVASVIFVRINFFFRAILKRPERSKGVYNYTF